MLLDDFEFIDLTHTLSSTAPHWREGCGFSHRVIVDYADCTTTTKFRVHEMQLYAGVGTHLDAPLHCDAAGAGVESLSLNDLIAPLVVMDVSKQAHESYVVDRKELDDFEKMFGVISKNSFVIIHTGWGKLWPNSQAYRNNLKFPTISAELAQALLDRDIVGLGVDTLSPDAAGSDFPVHQLILTAGKYLIENVANAHLLAAVGSYSFALPIKIQDGTEAPTRLIALQPKTSSK